MGFLRAGSNANSPPTYTGINVQTSAEGMVVPVVYGRNRVSPNLIWCDNFKQGKGGKKGQKGKGGGGKGSGSSVSYYAGLILSMCEGPVGFGNVYIDITTVSSFGALDLVAYNGTATQTPFDCISTLPGFVPIAYRNIAYLATNSYDLGSTPTVPQHNFEVIGFYDSTSTPTWPDVNPATIIYDLCTNQRYGLQMSPALIGDTTLYDAYCGAMNLFISPVLDKQEQFISVLQRWAQLTDTWIFWSENQMKFVPLGASAVTNPITGVSYTPVTTVRYNLGYDDFVTKKDEPPLTVVRSDVTKAYNWVKVNARQRGVQYSDATCEWKDLASIQKYGTFQANEIQADEVCDRGIAQLMATLIGQRALYLRNDFKFTLAWNYCLLEPGDIVTLTDPALGLSLYPVRIKEISENKDGDLAVIAEECPSGFGGGIAVAPQANASVSLPPLDVDPGDVNVPPLVFEPPSAVTAGASQIWIGASGGEYWGGATVYASVDNVTYAPIGTLSAGVPQGTLLSALPAHADPDTADTLAVDLTESQTVLSASVTDADADAGRTLCVAGSFLVGYTNGEVIGYGNVAPGGSGSYAFDLSYLRRGFYATAIAAHGAGQPFATVVPANMLQVTLPAAYVGVPVYLKLASFNIYGAGPQDISDVAVYEYVPLGTVFSEIAVSASALLPLVTGATPVGIVTNTSGVPIYVPQ